MYSASQGHIELAIGRDEDPVDHLGQGEIQTIVETPLRLKRQGIGRPEEPSISMVLQRNLAHLLQNGPLPLQTSAQLDGSSSKNISKFQHKKCRDVESVSHMLKSSG